MAPDRPAPTDRPALTDRPAPTDRPPCESALDPVVDAAMDLLLGASCVGCGRPGRLLCRPCAAALPRRPFPAWPAPTPPGLLEPWAAAAYDGTVRALVIGLKEHRLLALVEPLGALLAGAVAAAVTAVDTSATAGGSVPTRGPVLLVPVPSRSATVRARGHDATHAVTLAAARLLRRHGWEVGVSRLLRVRRTVRDQAGLDAAARQANLAGSMHCAGLALGRARHRPPGPVVVCDDVLTTGSTAREALRCLRAEALPAVAVAAVAATPRRSSANFTVFSADLLPPPAARR